MRRLGGTGYVLTCDIRHYFASVDHAVLKGLLRRKIRDPKLLRLVDSLLETGDEGGERRMPIGNVTSQLFANVYLDPLDHFLKEELRQKFYIRYMDDFVVLGKDKSELWAVLGRIEQFLTERLQLRLNPQRVALLPLTRGVDFLGYVVYPGGYKRVRRHNVVHVRRRLRALQEGHACDEISFAQAQGSIASWVGLAQHASAFRLSRALFLEHDVRNIGKRLLVKSVGG